MNVDQDPPQARAGTGSWLSIRSRDPHRSLTALTLTGLLTAVVLAVAGVPRANLHGPLHFAGIMDPLCGGTRATYLFAHGQWTAAWTYNPIIFPLAFAAAVLLCRTVIGLTTRRWLGFRLSHKRLWIIALLVAIAALEVRQQLHADLLMEPWTGLPS
ncbi:hypothetical protein GCM10029976_031600 [Kribbella albertanoniae]|uniref:DUF2752 domain-containing protein n=1 Tax=Kribbella albertanoniae TaxID=1266829 RepID=A0A4R4QI35_9ACTN|nr:DUF2752 domain-containing protein [Kribbella albertanoniae]TDC35019.1 DUF2752 domain-containing protein [Kribbella albertanoniae]